MSPGGLLSVATGDEAGALVLVAADDVVVGDVLAADAAADGSGALAHAASTSTAMMHAKVTGTMRPLRRVTA
jgi:hypothetical protein